MWTCKKCGSEEIIGKEIVSRSGKIDILGDIPQLYDEDLSTYFSHITEEVLGKQYICTKCGNTSLCLEELSNPSNDMFGEYWINKIELLDKQLKEDIPKTSDIKSLYEIKIEELNNLFYDAYGNIKRDDYPSFYQYYKKFLNDYKQNIEKYSVAKQVVPKNKYYYISYNLKIGVCEENFLPWDRLRASKWRFDSWEDCLAEKNRLVSEKKNKMIKKEEM